MNSIDRKQFKTKLRIEKIRDSFCFKNERVLNLITEHYESYDFFRLYWDTDIKTLCNRIDIDAYGLANSSRSSKLKAICNGINGIYRNAPSNIRGKEGWVVYLASQFKVINEMADSELETEILWFPCFKTEFTKSIIQLKLIKFKNFKGLKISTLSSIHKLREADLQDLSDLLYLNGVTDKEYNPSKVNKTGIKIKQDSNVKISKVDADIAIENIQKSIDVFSAFMRSSAASENSKQVLKERIEGLSFVINLLDTKHDKQGNIFEEQNSNNGAIHTSNDIAVNQGDYSLDSSEEINEKEIKKEKEPIHNYDRNNKTKFSFVPDVISNIEIIEQTSLSVLVEKINEAYGNYCIMYTQLIQFLASIGLYEENVSRPEISFKYLPTEDGEFNGINLTTTKRGNYRIYLSEKGQRNILILLRDFETSEFNFVK